MVSLCNLNQDRFIMNQIADRWRGTVEVQYDGQQNPYAEVLWLYQTTGYSNKGLTAALLQEMSGIQWYRNPLWKDRKMN